MSVIAGCVYKDKIVIASDSIRTKGWSKRTDFIKLSCINDLIIGGVGTCEEIGLMFRYAQTHKPETATERDVLSFIVEFARWKKDFGDGQIRNTYLIVCEGHLFMIEDMFVHEIKDFQAIGAGEDYANAAMYLGMSPEKAVKVACELSCFVAEPIVQYEMQRSI